MIFASLGSMDMPFTRMAEAVDRLADATDEEVIVQTGHTAYDYRHAKAFDFCSREKMQELISSASVVVLQGGWGTLSEAIEMGKALVAMPRKDKEEHIHDQFQLVRKLESLGCLVGVYDGDELAEAVEKARTMKFHKLKRGNAEGAIRQKLEEWNI